VQLKLTARRNLKAFRRLNSISLHVETCKRDTRVQNLKNLCVGFVVTVLLLHRKAFQVRLYEGVYKSFRTESITKIYAYSNKLSLRSNTKGYGGKTHQSESQNSDITAPSGREL
jgi:hypothetical protein